MGKSLDIKHQYIMLYHVKSVRTTTSTAPLHTWLWPRRLWRRTHINFASPLQIVYFYQQYCTFKIAGSKENVCQYYFFKTCLFLTYRLSKQLVTDIGPQFFSQEFSSFTKINRIKCIKIFPHHPASNEAMERLVQTFEKLMTTKLQKGVLVSQQSYEFLIGPLYI